MTTLTAGSSTDARVSSSIYRKSTVRVRSWTCTARRSTRRRRRARPTLLHPSGSEFFLSLPTHHIPSSLFGLVADLFFIQSRSAHVGRRTSDGREGQEGADLGCKGSGIAFRACKDGGVFMIHLSFSLSVLEPSTRLKRREQCSSCEPVSFLLSPLLLSPLSFEGMAGEKMNGQHRRTFQILRA